MSAIDNTPDNLNYLSSLNYKFQIKRAPHVNFFIQKVTIPRLYLKPIETPNPFVTIPVGGDHLSYDFLSVTFKVDEELNNYLQIHNWIRALGKPTSFEEYASIAQKPIWTGDGLTSDVTVSILSNIKTMNYDVTYIDAFPVNLSQLEFSTTDTDIKYLEATAHFRFTYYDIAKTI